MTAARGELGSYSTIPEPDLLFAGKKTHRHPLMGLLVNGPYSLMLGAPSRIRFALLAPRRDVVKLKGIVSELKRKAVPREAKNYYPEYPGFQDLFRIPIADQDSRLVIDLPEQLEQHA